MSGLVPTRGGLRAHLDEAGWALLAGSVGLPQAGLLAPLEGLAPSSGRPEAALVDAARLALTGPLRLELSSTAGDRGVVAAVGWDGTAGAGVVRSLAALDGRPAPAPGVELTVFPPERLVAELLRLFPPSRAQGGPPGDGPRLLSTAPESALMALRAVRHGDTALLGEITQAQGWSEVPDVLAALADEVRGHAVLAMSTAGAAAVQVRSWLQTGAGWVALGLAGGDLTHELQSPAQLGADLTHWLTGAASAMRETAR